LPARDPLTAKHVLVILIGCLTAAFGAWVTMRVPAAQGGPMLITLGASTVTGALGHAGQGGRPRAGAGEHTPVGYAGARD
jgi:hypothetical protein